MNDLILETEPLLKISEVAAILRISKTSAYRLTQGDLPAVRFGEAMVRVRKVDLEQYILEHLSRTEKIWET